MAYTKEQNQQFLDYLKAQGKDAKTATKEDAQAFINQGVGQATYSVTNGAGIKSEQKTQGGQIKTTFNTQEDNNPEVKSLGTTGDTNIYQVGKTEEKLANGQIKTTFNDKVEIKKDPGQTQIRSQAAIDDLRSKGYEVDQYGNILKEPIKQTLNDTTTTPNDTTTTPNDTTNTKKGEKPTEPNLQAPYNPAEVTSKAPAYKGSDGKMYQTVRNQDGTLTTIDVNTGKAVTGRYTEAEREGIKQGFLGAGEIQSPQVQYAKTNGIDYETGSNGKTIFKPNSPNQTYDLLSNGVERKNLNLNDENIITGLTLYDKFSKYKGAGVQDLLLGFNKNEIAPDSETWEYVKKTNGGVETPEMVEAKRQYKVNTATKNINKTALIEYSKNKGISIPDTKTDILTELQKNTNDYLSKIAGIQEGVDKMYADYEKGDEDMVKRSDAISKTDEEIVALTDEYNQLAEEVGTQGFHTSPEETAKRVRMKEIQKELLIKERTQNRQVSDYNARKTIKLEVFKLNVDRANTKMGLLQDVFKLANTNYIDVKQLEQQSANIDKQIENNNYWKTQELIKGNYETALEYEYKNKVLEAQQSVMKGMNLGNDEILLYNEKGDYKRIKASSSGGYDPITGEATGGGYDTINGGFTGGNADLVKALASGKMNGNKFFGVYATGDATGENRATIYNQISGMDMDSIITKYGQGKSPITVDMINQASQTYGVDPKILATFMIADSNLGTQGKAIRTMNPGNVGNTDSGATQSFNSWQEGVNATADNLAKRINAMGGVSGGQQATQNIDNYNEEAYNLAGSQLAGGLSKIIDVKTKLAKTSSGAKVIRDANKIVSDFNSKIATNSTYKLYNQIISKGGAKLSDEEGARLIKAGLKGDENGIKDILNSKLVENYPDLEGVFALGESSKKIGDLIKVVETGKIESVAESMARSLGGTTDVNLALLKANLGMQLSSYVKSISGAAVTDKEREFLAEQMAGIGDNLTLMAPLLRQFFTNQLNTKTSAIKTANQSYIPLIDQILGVDKITQDIKGIGATLGNGDKATDKYNVFSKKPTGTGTLPGNTNITIPIYQNSYLNTIFSKKQ